MGKDFEKFRKSDKSIYTYEARSNQEFYFTFYKGKLQYKWYQEIQDVLKKCPNYK